MTSIDWIAAGVIAISALIGLRRGLIGGLLGLAGIVVGAYIGAKLAPEFLSGRESPYTPLVALGGAAVLVILFQSIASMAGSAIRTSLFVLPPLRWLDSLGGLVLGAVAGVAIVWVLGAVALHLPGQRDLREEVQRSRILGEINERVPPSRLLDAIARVDPFLAIRGPEANVAPPDPALLASPAVRSARDSVFRVTGSACGLGVSGSGWAATPNLVVTNAHVVAGARDGAIEVATVDGSAAAARVVLFDPSLDVALLWTPDLRARALHFASSDPARGSVGAALGYPGGGPLTIVPAAVTGEYRATGRDIYDEARVDRDILELRAQIDRGDSGGPLILQDGTIGGLVFAEARSDPEVGYALTPTSVAVRIAPAIGRREVVATGDCLR